MDKSLINPFSRQIHHQPVMKLYPSGFYGGDQGQIITRDPKSSLSGTHYFDSSIFDTSKEDTILANLAVEELYKEHTYKKTRTFEFRQNAFKTVMQAFGTLNFTAWYLKQFDSKSFGGSNKDFIEDTIRFIMTGKRSLPLSAWSGLVGSDSKKDSDEYGPFAKGFFGVNRSGELNNVHLPVVLKQWLSQEGGFNDVIQTTHILFGITKN